MSVPRTCQKEDISEITRVHLAAFQGFFLTFLGARFLRELYDAIRLDQSGIEFIYSANGVTSGFVAGTDQPAGFYRRLICNRWYRFAWAAFPAILRQPAILPRLLRAFARPGEVLPVPNCGTLMSIAVDPTAQGQGVGKALVRAFLQETHRRGLDFVELTTDACHNEATNAFYLAQGFRLHGSFTTPEGRRMNEFIYRLADLDDAE